MRRYKTKQANPTRKIVVRDYSNNKSFTLQVPFSIGREFSIGAIQFVDNGNTYSPVQQIPASWYINLNV